MRGCAVRGHGRLGCARRWGVNNFGQLYYRQSVIANLLNLNDKSIITLEELFPFLFPSIAEKG